MFITGEDDDYYDMMQHFDEAHSFIEDARKNGGKVFIHCIMGINRSGLITTAHYMIANHIGPIAAARAVKKKRKIVLTNDGFQKQLIAFALERNLLFLDKDEVTHTAISDT